MDTFLIAGGTFALYSLLCRHVNIGILSSKRGSSDSSLSHSMHEGTGKKSRLGIFFESSIVARRVLLFVAILGTCMLIGDGILTPAISGLSPHFFVCLNYNLAWCLIGFNIFNFVNLFSVVSNGWTKSTVSFCE